jgi:hypothetical protein
MNKPLIATAMVLVCAAGLSAQWRGEVAQLFLKSPDYKAISERILQNYDGLESLQDKADAAGILAFCFGHLNDSANETRWIVEYFETGKGKDSGFAFLDLLHQADVIGWLNDWRSRYPLVTEIALIKGIGDQTIIPQGILPLVIEISTDSFYKFSRGTAVLEGGQFKSGFNIIALDANELFLNSGSRVYVLELKAGRLIQKKEIALEVEVISPQRAASPSSPRSSFGPAASIAYTLSMYIGGELVMTSTKVEKPVSLALNVKPSQNPFGFSPDYVLKKDQPGIYNSFSIFSAIGLIYSLLKDLLTKKGKKDVESPRIELVKDLSLVFKQRDMAGRGWETKVAVKLRTKNLPYVLSVP